METFKDRWSFWFEPAEKEVKMPERSDSFTFDTNEYAGKEQEVEGILDENTNKLEKRLVADFIHQQILWKKSIFIWEQEK